MSSILFKSRNGEILRKRTFNNAERILWTNPDQEQEKHLCRCIDAVTYTGTEKKLCQRNEESDVVPLAMNSMYIACAEHMGYNYNYRYESLELILEPQYPILHLINTRVTSY